MSRLSFRPRPLDIHKKLPIIKSVKEFEDDEAPPTSGTRNSYLARQAAAAETEYEASLGSSKKPAAEIPTPQFVVVDTYERDYCRTFVQTSTYIRARGGRAELGEFVEYDLDNEDEDWLEELNKDSQILTPETFETILFKLEVLDHKTRERAGVIIPTLGSPIPVLLTLDAATEALQSLNIKYSLFWSIYSYWEEKRERWQKPILRRLQPPPPVNDTNPYNVFRPREKTHRLHTRRMQRRENNVQSFDKLRQVRRNFGQARTILEALIKREEKKREIMECEVGLQRIRLKYKQDTELVEDSQAKPRVLPFSSKFALRDKGFLDSDEFANSHHNTDTGLHLSPAASRRHDSSQRHRSHGWLRKMDPLEPVLLFTKPLLPEKLAAAGIVPPSDSLSKSNTSAPPFKLHGRIGRGGRIVFDRSNPLMQTPAECGNSFYVPPKPRPSQYSSLHSASYQF